VAYLVLARKWRPVKFDDLVGQETIARVLSNAITENRIAHAYLFSGPRGVGKTSAARILAGALNCAEGPTPAPCGVCPSCLAIRGGSFMDVIEIDGASNNSVEDVRDLRERVKYAPAGARYKVYIIDEVHMLSQAAFNALLKTLEEPPPHVVFILATTSPNKVIATVLSRCQHLPFRRIASDVIQARLKRICDAEGLKADEDALRLIARAADGGMRDALTLLDQITSFSTAVTAADVKDLLGISDLSHVGAAASAVVSGDRALILSTVDALYESGVDLKSFMRDLTGFFRDWLVALVMGGQRPVEMDVAQEALAAVLNELLKGEYSVEKAYSQRIALEMLLLRVSFLGTLRPVDEIIDEIRGGAGRGGAGGNGGADIRPRRTTSHPPASPPSVPRRVFPSTVPAEVLKPPEAEKTLSADVWRGVFDEIYEKDHILGCKLADVRTSAEGDAFVISYSGGQGVHADAVNARRPLIEETLLKHSGRKYRVEVRVEKNAAGPPRDLKKEVLQNPVVRDAVDLFGGQVVDVKSAPGGGDKNGGDKNGAQ
jgi:DNA polymerase-3 subunit gamma/tau